MAADPSISELALILRASIRAALKNGLKHSYQGMPLNSERTILAALDKGWSIDVDESGKTQITTMEQELDLLKRFG